MAYVLVAIFLILVFFSLYSKREKLEILIVTGLSCAITGYVLVPLIRFFYHHPRPFMVLQVHQLITETAWSFPSRHAAFFFAMATAVYLYNKKWGIGFFVAASLIAVSRVVAGVHYPSDIVGGALLGIIVAYVAFIFVHKLRAK